jgi:hypothetical protein
MHIGPLRVGALLAAGLFVVFYVASVVQFLRVCEAFTEAHQVGYNTLLRIPIRIMLTLL